MRLLLVAGSDLNATQENGATPLILAAEGGHEEVVAVLLGREGIDLEDPGTGGGTALHVAAFNGNVEIVRRLLNHAAEIDAKDDSGATPLMIAFAQKHEEVVRLLVEQDAEARVKNNDGVSALTLARIREQASEDDLARLILDTDEERRRVHGSH